MTCILRGGISHLGHSIKQGGSTGRSCLWHLGKFTFIRLIGVRQGGADFRADAFQRGDDVLARLLQCGSRPATCPTTSERLVFAIRLHAFGEWRPAPTRGSAFLCLSNSDRASPWAVAPYFSSGRSRLSRPSCLANLPAMKPARALLRDRCLFRTRTLSALHHFPDAGWLLAGLQTKAMQCEALGLGGDAAAITRAYRYPGFERCRPPRDKNRPELRSARGGSCRD